MSLTPPKPPNDLTDSGMQRQIAHLRSHRTSLRDTTIGTAALIGGFYIMHVRLHRTEPLGWVDAVIFIAILLTGLAIGYRDRLPLLAGGASKVLRSRMSGRHRPPEDDE